MTAPARRTLADAMRGTRGVDYFPNDTCPTCGAMLYWNGARYDIDHAPERHGVEQTVSVQRASDGARETTKMILKKAVENAQLLARRSVGDRDEDD